MRFNLHHIALAVVIALIVGAVSRGWSLLWIVPSCLVLVAIVTDAIARPSSCWFYPVVTHGRRDSRCVALTFDDGPDPDVTPRVLDILERYGAQATFFTIGRALERQPALAQRLVDEGHVLGNHSWQHARTQNFRFLRWQSAELDRAQQALSHVIRDPAVRLYRPPMGLKIGALAKALRQRRLTLVAWSLHSHDTRLHSPEAIAQRVLSRVRDGDIVVLHDGHDLPGHHRPHCAEAVQLIMQGLQDRNLRCVTIPQLLAAEAPTSRAKAATHEPRSRPG